MTYNPSIPQSTDLISVSQGQILTNFGQLNTVFAVDHYAFNDSTAGNRGLHKTVSFPAVASDPSLSGAASQVYTKAVAGLTQLFFANASQITQITGVNSISSNGSITIPGGIVLKWGNFGFSGGSGTASVSFGLAFPNNFFSCSLLPSTVTPSSGVGSVSFSGTASTSGFTAYRSNTTGVVTYFYIAVGN